MGTKVQCKTVLPAFYSVKDINGSLSNGMCLLNNNEQTTPIGQHFESFSLRFPMDGYFEYEKEKVRQTILKHESTFRHQLQELHRLYNKQRDLMSDLRMRELHKNPLEVEGCLSHTPPDEAKRMWHANHFPLTHRQVSSSSGTHYPRALFGCRESANRAVLVSMQGNEAKQGVNPVRYDTYLRRNGCLADLNEPIVIEDDYTPISPFNDTQNGKKSSGNPFVERNGGTCLQNIQSIHGEYRHENFSLDINADAPSSDDLPSNTNAETEMKKKTIFGVVLSEGKGEQIFSASSGIANISSQNQRIELNVVETGRNGGIMVEKSYHMNLDLLQNCSHQFFKKSEAAAAAGEDAANVVNKKIFGVPIFNFSADSGKVNTDEAATANHFEDSDSGLRNQIDLNVSLHEEEGEALTVLQLEENIEDVTRLAAEAIVSISSIPSSSGDCLKWFADLISSQIDESSTLNGEEEDDDEEEDSIPEGMDYFEFTTLKLRDEKCYEPSILDVHFDGGGGAGGEGETREVVSKRRPRRRGPAARRDFQRDVLPGLVSLSRHEVSEDILTFQELLKKSGGSVWRSRMSRGRKDGGGGGRRRRRGGPLTNHHPMCSDSETTPEKMIISLTGGWGRRRRRRPWQRFPKGRTHME
ncbi:hypothetical protein DM860_008555 [Cuscuta australis]|uniref:Uncharacterized protein n=1 Tax=Cuscuta australis TaxID=267555 RepID=A0A328D4Y9_9ASTE|nr:hypothetical protein DM860_008555 [Cuscuta australis]